MKRNKYGYYSQYAGGWFNATYKKKCQLSDPEDKVFHSFRHTLANHLKQQGVDHIASAELLGHEHAGETLGRYAKKYEPQVLYERVVEFIGFESLGLDLSHLKGSKFSGTGK